MSEIKALEIIRKLNSVFLTIFIWGLLIANLLSIVVLWNYEFEWKTPFGRTFSNTAMTIFEILVWFGGMFATMVVLVWGWLKFFHEPVKEKLGDFKETLEEIMVYSFVWMFVGFFIISLISFGNEIVGFVSLIFYVAGYGWYMSDKIIKAKFISDQPELHEMIIRRNELLLELNEHLLDPIPENNDAVNEKHSELAALKIRIGNFYKSIPT